MLLNREAVRGLGAAAFRAPRLFAPVDLLVPVAPVDLVRPVDPAPCASRAASAPPSAAGSGRTSVT